MEITWCDCKYGVHPAKNMMEVDGYKAKIEYDPELDQFLGEILGLNGSADFYGKSPASLRKEFKNSLTVYLEVCEQIAFAYQESYYLSCQLRLKLFNIGMLITKVPKNVTTRQKGTKKDQKRQKRDGGIKIYSLRPLFPAIFLPANFYEEPQT
jgi:predicted HicB family RNase H-like nuclease